MKSYKIKSKHVFCLPPQSSFISGGNIYNRNLLNYIKQVIDFKIISFKELQNYYDKTSMVWLDSLYIYEKKYTITPKFGIIAHYLKSMFCDNEKRIKLIEIEKNIINKCNIIISTSSFTSTYLRKEINFTGYIEKIEPPIRRFPHKTTVKKDINKFIILSSIIKSKGIYEFLNSFLNKISIKDHFSIDIFGHHQKEDSYYQLCNEIITKHKETRITFNNPIEHTKLKNIFNNYSSLIAPSFFETFGMSVHEAFFNKKIVFCLDLKNYQYLNKCNFKMHSSINDMVDDIIKFIRDNKYKNILLNEVERRPEFTCGFDKKAKQFALKIKPL